MRGDGGYAQNLDGDLQAGHIPCDTNNLRTEKQRGDSALDRWILLEESAGRREEEIMGNTPVNIICENNCLAVVVAWT